MTRAKAIKLYCVECSGDSPQEVTMCPSGNCFLYPFRFGNGPNSAAYKKRMAGAISRYPEEWAEIVKDCPDAGKFLKKV